MRNAPLFILSTAAFVRLALLVVLPAEMLSLDIHRFEFVFNEMDAGRNPYATSSYLNYAPIWVQGLWAFGRIAHLFEISLATVVRLFLIGAELLLLHRCMSEAIRRQQFAPPLFLLGWALNPLPILITVQHGHFDVLVALCSVLFISALARFIEKQERVAWLTSCMWLGLGIALKSVPFVLVPLALMGFSLFRDRETRGLGVFLLFGVTSLTFGALLVVSPAHVAHHTILYTSEPGYFGITGIIELTAGSAYIPLYRQLFPALLLAELWMVYRLSRRWVVVQAERIREPLPLLVSFALFQYLFVITLGPGYGPQYLFWIFPFVLLSIALSRGQSYQQWGYRTWPQILFLLVSALTASIEYGVVPALGASMSPFLTKGCASTNCQTLLRLPLFCVLFTLLLSEGRCVWSTLRGREKPGI